jgi:lipoate-protein ligase A
MLLLPPFEGTVEQQLGKDRSLLSAGAEVLRFWESRETAVVLGRGNRAEQWVNRNACHEDGVPILRRDSGGGTVVIAQGCLNYCLVFSLDHRPGWRDVSRSFVEILGRMADALQVDFRPPCDLAWKERKVGGCAQRRTATSLLHHGTLLYGFDAGLAERYLLHPERQPPYRAGRPHREFLTNLPLTSDEIRKRVAQIWGTERTTRPPSP